MPELNGSIPLKRLETAKMSQEKKIALVDNKINAVRAKKKCLEEALEFQNERIRNMESKTLLVVLNREILSLEQKKSSTISSIKHGENMEAQYKEYLDFLNDQIDKGVKRVSRASYFIQPSKFTSLFRGGQLIAMYGTIIPTLFFTFTANNFNFSVPNLLMLGGIVSAELFVFYFLGNKLADKTVLSISPLEAKKIVQKRLQEEQDDLTKAREKLNEFPALIESVEKSLGGPTDDELFQAKQEKNEIEANLEAAKAEENMLLEEKIRLFGGAEVIDSLYEEQAKQEVTTGKQKSKAPLVIRHPGNWE